MVESPKSSVKVSQVELSDMEAALSVPPAKSGRGAIKQACLPTKSRKSKGNAAIPHALWKLAEPEKSKTAPEKSSPGPKTSTWSKGDNKEYMKARNRVHSKAYTPLKNQLLRVGKTESVAKKEASQAAKKAVSDWEALYRKDPVKAMECSNAV